MRNNLISHPLVGKKDQHVEKQAWKREGSKTVADLAPRCVICLISPVRYADSKITMLEFAVTRPLFWNPISDRGRRRL